MIQKQPRCSKMIRGFWALDHGRFGDAPCMKPFGHEGACDPDYEPLSDGEALAQDSPSSSESGSRYTVYDDDMETRRVINDGLPGNIPVLSNTDLIQRLLPDQDPYEVLKEFIAGHVLAIKMEKVPQPSKYETYRHTPDGCKHCEALAALDQLVESKNSAIAKLWRENQELKRLENSLGQLADSYCDEANEAWTALAAADSEVKRLKDENKTRRDSQQNLLNMIIEMGQELDKRDRALKLVMDSTDVAPMVKNKVKRELDG